MAGDPRVGNGENQFESGPVLEHVLSPRGHLAGAPAPKIWAPCARTTALVYDARPGHGNARFGVKPGFFTGVWIIVSDPRLGLNETFPSGYTLT